jgi:hypothetical protein
MTEQRVVYAAVDVEHLSTDQAKQLRFVLSVLSIHELVHLAARVQRVCGDPGFGKVTLTILKGHPSEIEAGQSEKLSKTLTPSELEELMR